MLREPPGNIQELLTVLFKHPESLFAQSLAKDFYRYFPIRQDADIGHFESDILNLLDCFGSPPNRLLDLACGYGLKALCFRYLGIQSVVGLDRSESMIRTALRLKEYSRMPSFTILQGSAQNLPFKNCDFDGVLLTSAISHLYDLESAFREVRRILVRGGVLVIQDDTNALHLPTRRKMIDVWHKSEFGDSAQLAKLGMAQNFYILRKEIIEKIAPDLLPGEVVQLAQNSRGWTVDNIEEYLQAKKNHQRCKIQPRFRCVNPITRVPQEQLLIPFRVVNTLNNLGFRAKLCPPPQWKFGKSVLAKVRKKFRLFLWPLQIYQYPLYYIRAIRL